MIVYNTIIFVNNYLKLLEILTISKNLVLILNILLP